MNEYIHNNLTVGIKPAVAPDWTVLPMWRTYYSTYNKDSCFEIQSRGWKIYNFKVGDTFLIKS